MGRIWRAAILYATAAAGLIGGHVIAYSLSVPDRERRGLLLVETGHGYISKAVVVAVAAAIVSILAAALLGALRGRGALRPSQLVVRLGLLQGLGYLALEAGERLLAGVPVSDLAGPVLLLGLPLQLLIAAIGSLLLAAVARTAAAVARLLSRWPEPRRVSPDPVLPPILVQPRPFFIHPRVTRGPPSTA
jgi:hypothetical protein